MNKNKLNLKSLIIIIVIYFILVICNFFSPGATTLNGKINTAALVSFLYAFVLLFIALVIRLVRGQAGIIKAFILASLVILLIGLSTCLFYIR